MRVAPRCVHPVMGGWKKNEIKRRGKRSETKGKDKNRNTCQASPLDKYMARRNRSYKHRLYSDWCKRKSGRAK